MKTRLALLAGFALLILLLFGLLNYQRILKVVSRYINDPSRANPAEVSLNRRPLPDPRSENYRFLVIGHGYGSTSVDDHLPDPALLASLPALEEMRLSMLVSLGDIVQHSIAEDFDHLDRSLLAPLSFPVFNTPGNHDVVNRADYAARYGQTYYSFSLGRSQMIFLDTERENCAIDQTQQAMLKKALTRAVSDAKTAQIFIFMHKTLFFANQRLADLQQSRALPNVMDCFASENFAGIMDQSILPAAQQKPIYLFGGDVGAWANLTPYYEKRTDANLTMVMTGLGDNPNNAGILVTVEGDQVRLEVYSLTGQAALPLESYTPEYWIRLVTP